MAAEEAILRVADVIGGLMEFWGFKRHMGRIWTVLYLDTKPLSAGEIRERLSMSAGGVSMALSDLVKWGVVKKTWIPGDRRDYYEPETQIWKMVSRVFRERELVQIQAAQEGLEGALESVQRQREAGDIDDAEHTLITERLQGLLGLAQLGETLLRAILSGESVDASPLQLFRFVQSADDEGEGEGDAEK